MFNVLLIMIGGAIGAAARYGVGLFAARAFGSNFPFGTLIVNLSGCFLIGFLFALGERNLLSSSARLFLITGFLGALTTFSSFALETVNAGRIANYATALGNILLNNVLGLILVVAGMFLAHTLFQR